MSELIIPRKIQCCYCEIPATVICRCKSLEVALCDYHILKHIDEEGEHPIEVIEQSSELKYDIELDENDLEASNIQVRGHNRPITSIAVVENFLFSGENDGIYKWDLDESSLICRHYTKSQVWSVSISRSLRKIAGGLENHFIVIFDYFTDEKLNEFYFCPSPVLCLKFSLDEKYLVAGCENGFLFSLYCENVSPSSNKISHKDAIIVLDITHDGMYIITACTDKKIRILETATAQFVKIIETCKFPVFDLKCTTENYVVFGGSQGILKIWNFQNEEMKSFNLNSQIFSILVSRDNKNIYVADEKYRIRSYDFHQGYEIIIGDESDVYITGLAFDDNEKRIFGIAGGWTVRVFNNDDYFSTENSIGHDRLVCVKLARDGSRLLAAYVNGGINIFNTNTGQLLRTHKSFEDAYDDFQELGINL